MRRVWAVAVAACLALGGAGCAYFNAMYNANRFAKQAERSERAGRTGEARDRWQSAATHAESLASRHPKSRWVIDALLVRGRALVHLEDYSGAVPVLEEAARRAQRPEQRYEALVMLGQANLAIRLYPQALQALDSAVGTGRRDLLGEALLYRGRTFLRLGNADSALLDFRASSHPRAGFDLAAVEVLTGDTAGAATLYDSLVPLRPYVENDWRPALDSLAGAGALTRVAALVDRLVVRRDLSPGQRARLLLDDGVRRLAAGDTVGAAARLAGVAGIAPDSIEAGAAGVKLAQLAIASAAGDSDLAPQRDRLQLLVLEGGGAALDAREVLRQLGLVDTLGRWPTVPDAFWFQRAEVLRDSLHAGRLAAVDFAEMATLFPASPWTPKGLVAAIAAGHPQADSLRALLGQRYAASPYAQAVAGESAGADAFADLEDSLRLVLAQRISGRPGARPGRVLRGDDEGDAPIGRRRPAQTPAAPRPVRPTDDPVRPRPDTGPPRPE